MPRYDPTPEKANLGRTAADRYGRPTAAERVPLEPVEDSVFYDINLSLSPSPTIAPHNGWEPSVEALDRTLDAGPWWETETDAQFEARMVASTSGMPHSSTSGMPHSDMPPADRLRARMLEDQHFSVRLLNDDSFRARMLSDEHFRSQVLAASTMNPGSPSRPRSMDFTWA